MCESAAPSTTNHMQPKVYIKDKVARKILIGIQYEIVFKSDRNVYVILAFLKVLLLLLKGLCR